MRLQQETKHDMVANLRVQEEDEKLRKRSQTSNDQEVILNYLRVKHNPTVFSSRTYSKRDSHSYARGWCILIRIWCQVLYNRILKTPIFHITTCTALEILNPAGVSQLSPSQALIINGGKPSSRINLIKLGILVHKTFR